MLLVATTRENVSPSLVLELLKRIGGIIKVAVRPHRVPSFVCHLSEHESRPATCCGRQNSEAAALLHRTTAGC